MNAKDIQVLLEKQREYYNSGATISVKFRIEQLKKLYAARFAKEVGAKRTVPLHWGLFDSIDPTGFDAETAVIPKMYQEINL